MKKNHICMLCLIVFGAALIMVATYVNATMFKNPPIHITQSTKKAISKPVQNQSELAYAIVIMPKSYRSMLRQFSNHPLARHIQIVPADMQWRDGTMVVQPKVRLTKGGPDTAGKPNPAAEPAPTANKILSSQSPPAKHKKRVIETAIMGLVLASASQKRLAR